MWLQSLDRYLRSSVLRRVVGAIFCAWVVGVIGTAVWAAYEDGLELYRWTTLVLLLFGVPIAVLATVYGVVLLGRRVVLVAVLLVGVIAGTRLAYETRQSNERAKAESVAEANRIASVRAQDRRDREDFGAECTASCDRLNDRSPLCINDCSRRRGAEVRRQRRQIAYQACAASCGSDADRYCLFACEMAAEDAR